jgi:TetR/AcrR family transcriptional regulator
MADIGAAAGLSRGAPGYFFGSKEELYAAVLQRVFDARDATLRPAFAPLAAWTPGERSLEDALGEAVDAYLGFLAGNPSFLALVEREGLAGGGRLRATPHASSAMEDAFAALKRNSGCDFDVGQVVVAFVSLCFFPLAHRTTFLPAVGIDPDADDFLAALRGQVVEVLLALVTC